jgi:hypothetical protein
MKLDDRPRVLRSAAGGPAQLKDSNSARPLAVRLVLLAAAVRAAYLIVVAVLAYLLPDYDTSAHLLSEHCADTWPEEAAAAQQYLPGVVWDSIFFHRIAACGYEYEQFYAFYPGLPRECCLCQPSSRLSWWLLWAAGRRQFMPLLNPEPCVVHLLRGSLTAPLNVFALQSWCTSCAVQVSM